MLRKIFRTAPFAVATLVLLVVGCGSLAEAQAPGKMPPAPVLVEKVGATIPVTLKKYTGMFEAINKVMSVARVSGNIVNITFKEGDLIKKGDLLFEIEDTVYTANVATAEANIAASQAAIKQAEAQIQQVTAQVRYAQATFDRNTELYNSGTAVSKDALENTESALDAAKAQLAA